MKSERWIGLAALIGGLSGCQCFEFTERYQDAIDHIADRRPHMDHWYHAGWDVSRIGQPDWYACPWNQHWVDPVHVRGYRPLPGYIHNPIPSPEQIAAERTIAPIPPEYVPAADPATPVREGDKLVPIRDPGTLKEGIREIPNPPPIPKSPLPGTQPSEIPLPESK